MTKWFLLLLLIWGIVFCASQSNAQFNYRAVYHSAWGDPRGIASDSEVQIDTRREQQIVVYRRALTQEQITHLFNSGNEG